MAKFKLAQRDEIPDGQRGLVVEAAGRQIAIFKVRDQFYAVDNRCLHEGASLGDGFLEGECITCPWHGWQYDVVSGASRNHPTLRLRTFQLRIEGEDIWLDT
ncbi:MAG TPA: non-heme iron oxygenase ferredoxin subunit [Candidatus Binataceae bacterium]|nr:non-heme iron oxygenase ferredoxin subunit [Candidatus Binataceae bacterium]